MAKPPPLLSKAEMRQKILLFETELESELQTMAKKHSDNEPLLDRIIQALIGTTVLAYVVFILLDLAVFHTGLGFVIGLFIVVSVLVLLCLTGLFYLWRWVYRGTGRYQMRTK